MRKISLLNWVSIDGFIAGIHGETDWFPWDSEIEDFYEQRQNKADTIIYGRETYEVMFQYWSDETLTASDRPSFVHFMNNTPKIVFSKSLAKADWNNTKIVKEVNKHDIEELKRGLGGDILIYGSGTIVSQLAKLDLIDEYALMVYPVVLGSGRPLFPNISDRIKLDLISTRRYSCGSNLHIYRPYN
ncbi:dihydrofolate reductase family protein [Sphingobacterium ginsenosidimutans]|uniref:Dihydrofolate reductase family protein n=1 Tax=Sphingobacterium ginsenosidimutans TaxID=687845 RepID=A0ABP7ZR74_9SPHI